MLSRVADSLYWMSRYLERAEHTARLLDVNLHGLLDQKPDVLGRRWARVLRALCCAPPVGLPAGMPDAAAEGLAVDPHALAYRLAHDPAVGGSIVNCIVSARQNAREVREQISSEMWEQLNRLYLHVQQANRDGTWDAQVHDFFQVIKDGAHLFQGITDSTMSHEEGWYFIQLGRYLERVFAVVNLLDAHCRDFGVDDRGVDGDRYLEWVGLLKSCTAFEAYCRVHTAHVQPEQAVAFLLLNPDFPHSVLFGVGMVRVALGALSEPIPALKHSGILRQAGKLVSTLSFDPIEEIVQRGIHAHLDDVRRGCVRIHDTLYDTCISIRFALTA